LPVHVARLPGRVKSSHLFWHRENRPVIAEYRFTVAPEAPADTVVGAPWNWRIQVCKVELVLIGSIVGIPNARDCR
jgi:hypothetical protein